MFDQNYNAIVAQAKTERAQMVKTFFAGLIARKPTATARA